MEEKKFIQIGLREKIILLFLQILLPFVMYIAINMNALFLGISAGILLVLSMLMLVVFG